MSPQQQQMLAQQARTQQQQVQPQNGSQAPSQAQAQALALSHALAQAQAAQAHSHSVEAQAAATLRGNLQQALSQNGTNGSPQLSPPYTSRDATSSPAHASPPRSTATPANGAVNSPRPPSAQAQTHPQGQGQSQPQGPTQHVQPVGMLQNGQITAMSIPQARNVQGHYYLPNVASYTPEQLQNVLRMQSMVSVIFRILILANAEVKDRCNSINKRKHSNSSSSNETWILTFLNLSSSLIIRWILPWKPKFNSVYLPFLLVSMSSFHGDFKL